MSHRLAYTPRPTIERTAPDDRLSHGHPSTLPHRTIGLTAPARRTVPPCPRRRTVPSPSPLPEPVHDTPRQECNSAAATPLSPTAPLSTSGGPSNADFDVTVCTSRPEPTLGRRRDVTDRDIVRSSAHSIQSTRAGTSRPSPEYTVFGRMRHHHRSERDLINESTPRPNPRGTPQSDRSGVQHRRPAPHLPYSFFYLRVRFRAVTTSGTDRDSRPLPPAVTVGPRALW